MEKKETADGFRKWMLPSAAVLVVGLAGTVWYMLRPLPPLRVTEYHQITHDGQNKILVGTDGNRLYLTLLDPLRLGQVPVTGGRIAQISVGVEDPWLEDVSPDGSSLLVRSSDSSMWEVGVLGNSARRLAAAAEEAAWSPDRKFVVYSTPKGEIFIARVDGIETRLLNPSVTADLGANEHADTHDLTWSPEGHRIRFSKASRPLGDIAGRLQSSKSPSSGVAAIFLEMLWPLDA